jgi:DNA polymerase-3 subunit delta'
MTWPALYGHGLAWERLCDTLARDRLPHALLFTGPPGVGKSLVARRLAARIACRGSGEAPCGECEGCLQIAAATHPDLSSIGLPDGKKEIGVEHARRLKHFAQMRAVAAPRKMAIVDDADRLSIAAQNALLKTLEEPPGRALLVLIAASPGSLLPTVRSRCQRIAFLPLAEEEVRACLRQTGLPADEAAELAARADGSPGRALLLRETDAAAEHEALLRLLAELDPSRYGPVVVMSKALGRTEQEMSTRLEGLLAWYRDAAARAITSPAGGEADLDLGSAVRCAGIVADALRTLRRHNPNRSLLAEALLLRLARA